MSQVQIAQPRMLIRPAAERPETFALRLLDRKIVDAGKATHHEPGVVELDKHDTIRITRVSHEAVYQDLLDAVNVGLARDRARRENEETLSALRARFEVLTPREHAILIQVAQGRLNKQIAGDMGITETTVKVHRSNMMRKIKAASLAELCRMVDKLKLLPENSEHS